MPTAYVPLPGLRLQVFHVGDGFEIFTSEKTASEPAQVRVRHPIMQTQNLEVMLTTGAGHRECGARNEHGDFLFSRASVPLTEHATLSGGTEYFPGVGAFFVDVDLKGKRQVGAFEWNAALVLEAAVAGTPLELPAQMFVQTATDQTTPAKVVLSFDAETPEWRAAAKNWLAANAALAGALKARTVSKPQVAQQMTMFRVMRAQQKSEMMNFQYGNGQNPVDLGELLTTTDTSAWMMVADATQTQGMKNAFAEQEGVRLKHLVVNARGSLYAAAQVCASYAPTGPRGAQEISSRQFIDWVQRSTAPAVGAQALAARHKVYGELIDCVHEVKTAIDTTAIHRYMSDETFALVGNLVQPTNGAGEKQDLAFGAPWMNTHCLQRDFRLMSVERERLAAELKVLGAETKILEFMQGAADPAKLATLAAKTAELCVVEQALTQKRQLINCGAKDCEDGAYLTEHQMKVAQSMPLEIFEAVKPFIGTSVLRLENMFPAGTGSVEELHGLVRATLVLVSDALKWQAAGADGATVSYETCFGTASAPKMQSAAPVGVAAQPFVAREQCNSYGEWLLNMFQGMAGHSFAARVTTTPIRTNADGSTIERKQVAVRDLMETTVSNVVGSSARGAPAPLANKHVQLTIGGLTQGRRDLSHEAASEAIGTATLAKLTAELGNELQFTKPARMEGKTAGFYNLFVHIGSAQCVSGEVSVNAKTSRLPASTTAQALCSAQTPVAFCSSAVAWNGCPATTVTTSTVISVPLAAEEQRRLRQLAHELAPLHSMTREQLAFYMTEMGHAANAGFEGGTFCGMDLKGSRLDSDSCVSLAFVVHRTPLGDAMPEWWDPKTNASALIRSKVQAVLPGADVRVHEIERDLHVMQVVFDTTKPAPPAQS